MNRIIVVFLLFLGGTTLSAQSFDTYRRQQQEAFQMYKQKTQDEWEAFRRKANEDFAEYLKKPWVRANGQDPLSVPLAIPDIPPVVLPELDIVIPEDNRIDIELVPIPAVEDKPIPVAPIPYKPKVREKEIQFIFLGTTGTVRFDIAKKGDLTEADEGAVSRFWKTLSGEDYDNLMHDCLALKEEYDLCNWAFFKMTEALSTTLYQGNAATIFHAWMLTQAGFRVGLGRDGGTIRLLLCTQEVVFHRMYWNLQGGKYYLLDEVDVKSMHVFQTAFPGTQPMSLLFRGKTKLENKKTGMRSLASREYPDAQANVVCNANMLSFMDSYPPFAIPGTSNQDWRNCASVPLSESASRSLLPGLRAAINGKNEADAANILLNFVQTAFEYKTDNEVWGTERAFFPEETLYYPFCDCEDRAVLFCRLIQDLMGLETALVFYPGHLAAAVHFHADIPGDYFVINGKRYLICDPTYINAPIGWTMPGMDNATAQVYLL